MKLIGGRRNYGELRKCEFHIHTPASHDYELIPGGDYSELEVSKIILFAYEIGYFNVEQKEQMLNANGSGDINRADFLTHLAEKGYSSYKEYLSYKLIAHKLYESDIEIAVISDHNTISGYRKLDFAVKEYFLERIKGKEKKQNIVKLILGVEISCSEKIHLIGIFDEAKYETVQNLINNHIPSQESGTYETSLSMIEKISEIGGIAYIAHINTADLKNTTGLYKETLFNDDRLNVIGLTVKEKEKQLLVLRSNGAIRPEDKFCFVYEGDSHQIDQIGKKNTWIKMSKAGFDSLKKAFYNNKLCVFIEKPNVTDKYIQGILIKPGKYGYLKGKNEENTFIVDFSNDLNCIIGGRGTGKSTILNILEIIFTLETFSYETLKFICKNEFVLVNFIFLDKEYLIRFIPQVKKNKVFEDEDFFEDKAFKSSDFMSGHFVLEHHWIELYVVDKGLGEVRTIEIKDASEKLSILEKVYRKSYSINNIVNQINNNKTGEFIKEVVFNGFPFQEKEDFLKTLRKLPSTSTRTFLSKELTRINTALIKREQSIDTKFSEFNRLYNKQFQVVYSPKIKKDKFYINILLFYINRKQFLSRYNITWGDVERFILSVTSKIGFIRFLNLLVNNRFKEIESYESIIDYSNKHGATLGSVESERKNVDKGDLIHVYREIRDKILSDKKSVILCMENYFEAVDDFSLLFNVNSKENVKTIASNMKDISELSLGQKVVTILTFIFEYGKFFNDNTRSTRR
jgi:predicted metal-dependent phosphoesterase TrpH